MKRHFSGTFFALVRRGFWFCLGLSDSQKVCALGVATGPFKRIHGDMIGIKIIPEKKELFGGAESDAE